MRRMSMRFVAALALAIVPAFRLVSQPPGPEFRVNSYTTNAQSTPAVSTAGDGSFVAAWSDAIQDGSGYGVFAQRYASDGSPLGAEFRVNAQVANDQKLPSIAVSSGGNFMVAWYSDLQDGDSAGVFARLFASDGSPQSGEFRVNTFTTSTQLYPSVAVDAVGDFVVAWQSFGQDGSSWSVAAQ